MIYDDIGRDGILSLANARRDANLSRMGATDQYEADVADFINNEVTDIENNFMSGGNTFEDIFNIQPPSMPPDDFQDQIFVPPIDNIYDGIFDDNIPPFRPPIFDDEPPFVPPIDDFPPFVPPIDGPPPIDRPPFVPPIDEPPFRPPFRPPIDEPPFRPPIDEPPFRPPRPPGDGPIEPPFTPPVTPPNEPPYTPPYEPPTPPVDVSTPTTRGMYRPPTDFSSGAPSIRLSPGVSTRIFGQAPGFVTAPINRPIIIKPPQVPPDEPPKIPPPDDRLRLGGMKFGGPLNAGIMRLPQSQQGDTMTTRIFQNAFKPRR